MQKESKAKICASRGYLGDIAQRHGRLALSQRKEKPLITQQASLIQLILTGLYSRTETRSL